MTSATSALRGSATPGHADPRLVLNRDVLDSLWIAAVLTAASYLVGLGLGWTARVDPLEAFAVLTSYSCTYLCVRQRRFNYPIGALSTAATMPAGLLEDALADRSDLYLLTRSDIPFAPDPLRYGGDGRETTDAFWVRLAERHGLPHHVLTATSPAGRLAEAKAVVLADAESATSIGFQRRGEH